MAGTQRHAGVCQYTFHEMRWPSLQICIVFFGSVRLFICFYSIKTSFVNILLC